MSAFNTPWFNSQETNFFNVLNKTKIPHIVLTAETEDFDEDTTRKWKDEGFDVKYVPLLQGGTDYINRVHNVGDSFGPSEQYAIVAYGGAASLCLQAHTKPNNPRLIAVVGYYPHIIPSPNTKFPASVRVVVHLAGTKIGVRKQSEALGIQGKAKTTFKSISPGVGFGQKLNIAYPAYTYSGVEPGFAEHDLEEYDAIADGLAFTRSIACVRKGFRIENDIETVRDRHVMYVNSGNQQKAMQQTHQLAHIINTPTLTGGIGAVDVQDFYENFFTPLPKPSNVEIRLMSRTIGTDRVVDELFISLTHSLEIPWLLPGVPATNKKIQIAMVSIFHVRGEKLESEHVYWDQAAVLVQAGLLDPKLVPQAMKKKGVKELPVVGAESAQAIKQGGSQRVNELIPDW